MPARGNDLKATVRLEGGAEFKREITDINSSMKQLDAESKQISATFDGQANSLEALTAKQQNLVQTLELAERKVSAYGDRIQSLKTQQTNIAESTEKYRTELKEAQNALSKMDKGTDAYAKQEKAVDALARKVALGEQNQQRANSQIEKYRLEQTKAETAVAKLNREVDQNAQYLREAERSADGCADSIDEYGRRTKQAAEESQGLGDVAKVALGNIAANAAQKLADMAVDAVKALVDAGKAAAAYADEILTASTVTGLSTDTLQEYAYAAELIDTDLADVEKALGKNVKSMASAQSGSKAYAEAYEKLGVSVTDANGNLRKSEDVFWDCIDALGNVQNETEADAIAMQIFGKSARDLSPLIETGSEGFRNFADEAHEAGAVLNGDTLDSLGRVDDSLQRLDSQISAFKNAAGASIAPLLGSLAEGATDFLKAMTNAFTPPPKSDLEEFISNVRDEIEATQESIEGLKGVDLKIDADVSNIEQYRSVLEKATTNEKLSEFEKYQLQKAVETLGGSIPELKDAYDEETSSISLTTDAMDELIKKAEEQIKLQAYTEALETAYKAQADAVMEAAEAQSAYDKLAEQGMKDFGLTLKNVESLANNTSESAADLALNLEQLGYGSAKELERYIIALQGAKTGIDDANQAQKDAAKIAGQTESAYKKVAGVASETNNAANKNKKATEEATEAQKEENKAVEEFIPLGEGFVNKNQQLFDSKTKQKEATAEHTEAIKEETAALGEEVEAEETLRGAAFWRANRSKDTEKLYEERAARAKESAEAEKVALETTRQAWEDNYNDIKNTLTQKLSLWDAFDGGEDVTVEQMIANLQDQNEGIKQYQQEMQEVIDAYGDELGPDLINTLQSMGTDAANTWHHMWVTMQQDNAPELFAEMGAQWTEGLDLSDQIASYCAGNLTAYQLATGQMGSTKIEWTGLRESVDEMTPELDAAIQAAQNAGVAIPNGLSEGLASGETTTTAAAEQITSSMKGTFEGLYEIAQQSGADIPEGLEAGIDGSAEGYQAAINALTESLSEAGKGAGEGAASEIQTGMEGKQSAVQTAASTTAGAAKKGLDSKKSEFQSSGSTSGTQYAAGVRSQASNANSAGKQLSNAAKNGTTGHNSAFRGSGRDVAAAFAAGIRSGSPSAINAAVDMAVQAYKRAKAAIGQHSPTGIFKDELGRNVPLAFAAGIKKYQRAAESAAASMAEATFSSASYTAMVNGMNPQTVQASQVSVDTTPIARMLSGRNDSSVTVYMTVNGSGDAAETGRAVARELRQQLRMG
jgi:hypothetical protein